MKDEIEPVPPCRVYRKEGKAVHEVLAERPREYEKTLLSPERPLPSKFKLIKHGKSWNHRPGITVEAIAKLKADGLSVTKIAEQLKCSESVVYRRLHEGEAQHDSR